MSFTFHIPIDTPRRVSVSEVLEGLYPDALRIHEPLDRHGAWPEGYLHLYLHDRSTRSVEVSRYDGGIDVRLMSCSNHDDHALCLALVRRFSQLLERPIEPEDGGSFSLETFHETFDSAWIMRSVKSGPSTMTHLIELQQSTITLFGCVRSYHLGPLHLQRLKSSGPAVELTKRLLEDMRRVQAIDSNSCRVLDTYTIARQDESFTLAVLSTDERCLVPKVDRVALPKDGELFMIAAHHLPDLIEVENIDEHQILYGPIPASTWRGLLDRAAAYRIELGTSHERRRKSDLTKDSFRSSNGLSHPLANKHAPLKSEHGSGGWKKPKRVPWWKFW